MQEPVAVPPPWWCAGPRLVSESENNNGGSECQVEACWMRLGDQSWRAGRVLVGLPIERGVAGQSRTVLAWR